MARTTKTTKKRATAKTAKRKTPEMVSVKVGKLSEPLMTIRRKAGTALADILEAKGIEHDNTVRVNGARVAKDYVVADGDIITITARVSGGQV